MDAEGNVVGQPADRTVEAFVSGAKSVKAYLDLKDKEGLSKDDSLRLLNAEIELGKVTVAEAKTRVGGISGITDEDKKQIDEALIDLIVVEMLPQAKKSPDMAAAAGSKCYAMYKGGARPKGKGYQSFYMLIMEHGKKAKDPEAFSVGLEGMRTKFGHIPSARRFFQTQEATLEQLKKEAAAGGGGE